MPTRPALHAPHGRHPRQLIRRRAHLRRPRHVPPAHTYAYRSTTKGCDLIGLDSLSAALGDDAGNFAHPNYQKTSFATFARCDRQFGAPSFRSLVDIEVMVGKPGNAVAGFWAGMRAADAKDHTLTAVPGLAAQGAYGWTDDQIGPHLTMYDGNLYLRVSINQVTRQTVAAPQVTELLNEIARNAMSAMAS